MYTKTTWIARVGTALNRFLKTNEDTASVELTNDPTGITTAGTPFTVANMNNIETGIKDNDTRSLDNVDRLDVVEGTGTIQGVGTEDDVSFGTVNTGQGANELYDMDQNVKTTDDVTFNDIDANSLEIGDIFTAGDTYISGNNTLVEDEYDGNRTINFIALSGGSIRLKAQVKSYYVSSTYKGYCKVVISPTSTYAGYDSGVIADTSNYTTISEDITFHAGDTISVTLSVEDGGSYSAIAYWKQLAVFASKVLDYSKIFDLLQSEGITTSL